ncbi:ABC transporter substrate-binding protein [Luteimicrobium subarcticum]|uniref:Peptide/nickel transport system substrate-binding protein n=1 Tax=Luteimicrobium subarcticum TaxID=620910 RepID=A0A2M8W1G7_9MICO|nr:ABC transporter substrate-binding protein [Luteimicrobium subarcticum]PJI84756.1 peptide/nickel transport system substrate-binding protein [Luteimicrobium subarcticum]
MKLLPSGRRSGRRTLTLVAAGCAAALTLAACSGGSSSGDSTGGGDAKNSSVTIAGNNGAMTENFNPFMAGTALAGTLGVIYEPLYYYNLASDQKPQPLLATGFSWNDDGTQLTITTRDGVKWSDGEPFSANDVAYTFNLLHDTPALNTSGLAATAKATDDHTVVLTFKGTSYMQEPSILGNQAIVPEHVWKNIADPTKDINKNPVGTGPYMFKSFTPQSYVLEKNPNYWEAGKPVIQQVRYISLDTADAASAALTAGQADWMSSFLPGLDQLLKGHQELSYVNTPALTTSVFTCSSTALGCKGPQTDPAVRQAIYYAMDRTQLNKLAGGGFAGEASPTLLLPDRDASWIADPANVTTPQSADTAKADQILDAAGWTKGSDGIRSKDGQKLSLTIQTVSGWSDYISINDTLKQQLKAVGIDLKPVQLAWNEWNANETNGTYQLSLDSIGLGASSNPYFTYEGKYDSANTAKVGESAAAGNSGRYSNPTVDKALATAGATNDEAVQKAQYAIVQQEVVKDMPYIPIYINSALTEFNNTRVTGWPTNDNKYAFAATWKAWDNGIVLKNLTPAK